MTEHETSRGLRSRSASPSRPHAGHQPGPEGLDQHVGAPRRARAPARGRPRRRGRARPSACCGSARGSTCCRSSRHGGPHARVSSPPPGRSTLITSAPRSPSVIAANGPASTREKSATRRPSSGAQSASARSLVSAAMRTLVVSDLHLGAHAAAPTCCAAPSCASRCSRRSRDVDRLVILGDALELREAAAARRAPSSPRPCFADARRGARRPTASSCSSPATTTTGSSRAGSTARLQTEPPGLPRARAADRARATPGRSPRALAEHAAPARVERRLPRRVAARRRLRDPRPLLRPPHHRADLRAPRRRARWRAGSCSLPEHGATRRRLRGGAGAALRVDARARPARRAHGAMTAGAGASARAWVALAGEGRRRRPVRARRARRGLRGGGRGAQRRRPRPDRPRPLRRGAAPRRAARHARGAARGSASTRAVGAVRPLAPRGPVAAATTSAEWTHAGGHAAAQHRQLGLPAALPRRRPNQSPYWPGTAIRSTTTARPSWCACSATAATTSCAAGAQPRREAGGVAGHAGADLELEHARACGAVLDERVARRAVDRDRARR